LPRLTASNWKALIEQVGSIKVWVYNETGLVIISILYTSRKNALLVTNRLNFFFVYRLVDECAGGGLQIVRNLKAAIPK